MKKITVIIAILLTAFVSGCAKKKPTSVIKETTNYEDKYKPPTSIEEAYNATRYIWDEYSKTEITRGKGIDLPFRTSDGDTGQVYLYIEKVDKEYSLTNVVVGGVDCGKSGCYSKYVFDKAIDKNGGELTLKSKELGEETWFITDKQIKIMSNRGAVLRFYRYPFPTSGSIEVHVPAVYVQGFLKKANEYRKKQ